MVSEWLYDLCQDPVSVTSKLSDDPRDTPADIIATLLHDWGGSEYQKSASKKYGNTSDGLESGLECGNWGCHHPSDLFLRIYQDALSMLEKDPLAGVTSPSLMGSSGVIPLTVIGSLPDICRHMSNCIVRAEKEVVLVMCNWMPCRNATLITNAIRELSVRAGKRGEKLVFKMVFERATTKNIFWSHNAVSSSEAASSGIQLPSPEEIPNIDLQVMACHTAWLGTLHSKFMIVDRSLALVESNNIQDNDNLEMMVHVEGPIVDSLYDMALITWHDYLDPPLPLLNTSAASKSWDTKSSHSDGEQSISAGTSSINIAEHVPESPHYDSDIVAETRRVNASLTPRDGEKRRDCVTRHLNVISRPDITGDAPEWGAEDHMSPYILHAHHDPFPMAMVCRKPYGPLDHSNTETPQNAAFLSAINNSRASIFIQTPNLNAEPLFEPLLNAVRRGVSVTCYLCLGYNDEGELLPYQNGVNEMTSKRLYNSLSKDEEKNRLQMFNYVGKDQTKPIHNKFKTRSCHIKLMIVDQSIAIQGSANLDTQTYFHSQETNLLLDSPQICCDWLDALHRNQNTATYGAVSKDDGCWRDPETGEVAVGTRGADPGRFSWLRGIFGALNKVRGVGGI